MKHQPEAFSRVLIDAQLADQGWKVQDPNSVRYEVALGDGIRADYVVCDRHAHKLQSVGVLPTELAHELHVPAKRITQIIAGKRDITAGSALRLAHWFSNAPEFSMNLQARYDVYLAARQTGREITSLPTKPVALAAKRHKQGQAA